MVGLPRTKRVSDLIYVFSAILLASFTPLYMWDTHVTARPRPESIGVAELTRQPVATFGPITPAAGFQGFSPFLSRALIAGDVGSVSVYSGNSDLSDNEHDQ